MITTIELIGKIVLSGMGLFFIEYGVTSIRDDIRAQRANKRLMKEARRFVEQLNNYKF